MSTLERVDMTRAIGSEVRGIKLNDIDQQVADEIRQLVAERCVLVFRDQPMTPEEQARVGSLLGELLIGDGIREDEQDRGDTSLTDAIKVLHTDANSTAATGDGWHSDRPVSDHPPALTMLRIETPPPVGGDTAYSSMYHAFETLSPAMQEFLLGLTAVFSNERYASRPNLGPGRVDKTQEHPVVRTHPLTGRKALYVSSLHTKRIVQLSERESDALLRFLYSHIEGGVTFQARVHWEPNTVTIWDNRCTQHYAIWDYFPETRHGYRLVTAGEKPFQ